MKTKTITFITILLGVNICLQAQSVTDTIAQTNQFSFHNNKWVNLHHFLFERASHQQHTKLSEDGLNFLDIGEQNVLGNLSQEEQKTLEDCIKFYRKEVIGQELLHSGRVLKWLQKHKENEVITDTTFSKKFTSILNKINKLYTEKLWPIHKKHNTFILAKHLHFIKSIESKVIHDLEHVSGIKWSKLVRVDITTYGNWASAYSPANDNIVVSTIDPLMQTSVFIEFVFHEGSHLLFLRNSPFRKKLFETAKTQDIAYPKQLWHAAMFYLCGLSVKNHLKTVGVEHQLIMEQKQVFLDFYTDEQFKKVLNAYYDGSITLSRAFELILKKYQE